MRQEMIMIWICMDVMIYDEILMKTEQMTWNVPDKKV